MSTGQSAVTLCVWEVKAGMVHSTCARALHEGWSTYTFLHCVLKNVPPLTCYSLVVHHPITIFFGDRL